MSTLVAATKVCRSCGEGKNLTEFSRNRRNPDGLQYICRPCASSASRDRQARMRERMGEDAYLAHKRELVQLSRERRQWDTERAYRKARNRAVKQLIDNHRAEFDRLLAIARREVEA